MVIMDLGRLNPDLNLALSSYVPNKESNFSKAPFVQIMKRPRCPPGAKSNRDRLSTKVSSTPGRFLSFITERKISLIVTRVIIATAARYLNARSSPSDTS